VGTDREGRRRQVDYDVQSQAEGWREVEFSAPKVSGQTVGRIALGS